MRNMARMALVLVLSCLASQVYAGPPYNIDDPGTAEFKHFNLAVGYQSSQVSGSEAQALPRFDLAYGLTNNIELGLGFGFVSVRNSGSGRIAGFGDMGLAVKWRFKEETKRCPQFGLGYAIKIPTADPARGLGTGIVDHTFTLSTAKSFKRATVFANLGYNFIGGDDSKNNLFYGVGVTYQATETLILGAQVYGNTPSAVGASHELAWGVGLTYAFAPDRAFLLSVGKSERGFSDLNLYAGFGFTFK